jgi:hypothetical protein
MKIFSIIFLLAVLLFSCKNEPGSDFIVFTEDDLPAPIFLKGKKYNFEEIINPRYIFLKEGHLIVTERKNEYDNKIHIIDIANETYKSSKGIHGLGPGEITLAYKIEDRGEVGKFWTFDMEQIKFSKFDLYDTRKLAEEQTGREMKTGVFSTDLSWTSDTTLLSTLVDGWTKYFEFTTSGDTLRHFGTWKDMVTGKEYPKGIKKEELDANVIGSIFQGDIKGNPSKTYFILAGSIVDFIEIIHLESETIKTIYGPVNEIPNFEISYSMGYQMASVDRTSPSHYIDVYPGENSFFLLYSGKNWQKFSDTDNLNRIFEMDYEGNILNQYQVDFPLLSITVDEKNKKIYALTVDEEPNVVAFSLTNN